MENVVKLEESILLEDSTLDKNSMLETKEIMWTVFVWRVPDYSKLQENVVYYRKENIFMESWTLMLTKTEEKIFLTLSTTTTKQFVNFSIVSSNGTPPLNDGKTTNFVDGKFVESFSMEAVSDPNNGYLDQDTLIVHCKYIETQADSRICLYPWDEHRKRMDVIKFQNDWREMYLHSRFCDFQITVAENVFHTHKVILAARSMHFHNMFRKDSPNKNINEMSFRASPYVFHEVLMYMYTGELVETGTHVMLEFLDIAHRLYINSLILKCQDALYKRLEVDNVKNIYRAAKYCANSYLKFVCISYMKDNCSYMLVEFQDDIAADELSQTAY